MACVSKVSVFGKQNSMFQRTVRKEFFMKLVLKRGRSKESRALIEYDRSCFFAIQLIRVLGQPSVISLMHAFKNG